MKILLVIPYLLYSNLASSDIEADGTGKSQSNLVPICYKIEADKIEADGTGKKINSNDSITAYKLVCRKAPIKG